VTTNDDSHTYAVILTQMLADKDDNALMPSILNILSHNPELAKRLPKVTSFFSFCYQ